MLLDKDSLPTGCINICATMFGSNCVIATCLCIDFYVCGCLCNPCATIATLCM